MQSGGQMRNSASPEERISEMVLLCWDSLNTYGKEPEQLASANALFQDMFKGKDVEDVTLAFRRWLKEKKDFPAPSDIYKIYEAIQASRARMREYGTAPVKPKLEKPGVKVSWSMKTWGQFTEQDKINLAEHLKTLTAEEYGRYKKYLIKTVGVPGGLFND